MAYKTHFHPPPSGLGCWGGSGAPWSSGFQWVQPPGGTGRAMEEGRGVESALSLSCKLVTPLTRTTAPRVGDGSPTSQSPRVHGGAFPTASLIFITDLKPCT